MKKETIDHNKRKKEKKKNRRGMKERRKQQEYLMLSEESFSPLRKRFVTWILGLVWFLVLVGTVNEYRLVGRIAGYYYKKEESDAARRRGMTAHADNEDVFYDFVVPDAFRATSTTAEQRSNPTTLVEPTTNATSRSRGAKIVRNGGDEPFSEQFGKHFADEQGMGSADRGAHKRHRKHTDDGTNIVWRAWPSGDSRQLLLHEQAWDAIRDRNPAYSIPPPFGPAQIRLFMQQQFANTRALQAYNLLPTPESQAEFWRYCVLYLRGGIYVDVPSRINVQLDQFFVGSYPRAVIGFEGNSMENVKKECRPIWRPSSSQKYLSLGSPALSHIPVQWAMVFPTPRHPILNRTIELMTNLVLEWNKSNTKMSSLMEKQDYQTCLTGSHLYAAAVNQIFKEAGQSWSKLNVTDGGTDYQGKMTFRVDVGQGGTKESEPFDSDTLAELSSSFDSDTLAELSSSFAQNGNRVATGSLRSTANASTKIVWRTWVTDKLGNSELGRLWQFAQAQNPDYQFPIVTDHAMENFMQTNFAGTRTLDAFQSINPAIGAMRADFWRYCVLYVHGGVYVDMDSQIQKELVYWVPSYNALVGFERNENKHGTSAAKDCGRVWRHANAPHLFLGNATTMAYFAVQWALVFPMPRHPVLRRTIHEMTNLLLNWTDTPVTNRWDTRERVLCLTGPRMYTVALDLAYQEAGRNWAALNVTFYDPEKGETADDASLFDFGVKISFKIGAASRQMVNTKTPYSKLKETPLLRKPVQTTG